MASSEWNQNENRLKNKMKDVKGKNWKRRKIGKTERNLHFIFYVFMRKRKEIFYSFGTIFFIMKLINI